MKTRDKVPPVIEPEEDFDELFPADKQLPDFRPATFDFYKPHDSVAIVDWKPSLTRQEFAEECDINTIMAKYEHTGMMPSATRTPSYIDMTDVPDNLADTLRMMEAATARFMELPARVRKEFNNDPVEFVDFASNPNNLDQLADWGLAERRKPPEAPAAPPALSAAPAAAPAPATAVPAAK